MTSEILTVDGLTVSFGDLRAIEDISLQVAAGDIYAIVGESGCGKSTLVYSLLGLVPPPGRVTSGEVRFRGRGVSEMSSRDLRRLRGPEVGMVFQAAMNSFNPVLTIGRHVDDMLEAHHEVFSSPQKGKAYFAELLRMVRLSPDEVLNAYAHQLSGGMKQRVAIAVALLLRPSVLVLDEPTTALDVLNQRLVLDVLRDLHKTLGVTIVFVTHDLGIVAELADRVAVMYAGRLVACATVGEIFANSRRHPYVAALISAIPSVLAEGLRVAPIAGQVPNLADLPPGCRFAPRCRLAQGICHETEPPLFADSKGNAVACHVVNEGLVEEITR
jgi:oligopeptide/dipeptide ABC transporter ATP-binding protein